MDLTFHDPVPYFSVQYQTLLSPPGISTERIMHINWALFPLWPNHFILSGAISNCPLVFPRSILDTSNLVASSSGVLSFCLFILFVRFSHQEYWSGFHFLLQSTTICQNCALWPVCLGWPCTAWLIVSLSYASPFTMARLWSRGWYECSISIFSSRQLRNI